MLLPPNSAAPTLFWLLLNLLLGLLRLDLLFFALQLLLHPYPGLLPDIVHTTVFNNVTISKAFLIVSIIACLPVERLFAHAHERLSVEAAPDGSFLRPPVVGHRA